VQLPLYCRLPSATKPRAADLGLPVTIGWRRKGGAMVGKGSRQMRTAYYWPWRLSVCQFALDKWRQDRQFGCMSGSMPLTLLPKIRASMLSPR
jgi:hypothetical protein